MTVLSNGVTHLFATKLPKKGVGVGESYDPLPIKGKTLYLRGHKGTRVENSETYANPG